MRQVSRITTRADNNSSVGIVLLTILILLQQHPSIIQAFVLTTQQETIEIRPLRILQPFGSLLSQQQRYNTRCLAIQQDNNDETGTENNTKNPTFNNNFNPFNYNAANYKIKTVDQLSTMTTINNNNNNLPSISTFDITTQQQPIINNNNRIISLRQQRMKEITTDLLATGGDSEAMKRILQENREFLMEPLEDVNCVLDDAMIEIYGNCQTTADRYRAYEKTMNTRIASARNRDVKQLLTIMKDFVLSCEVQQ